MGMGGSVVVAFFAIFSSFSFSFLFSKKSFCSVTDEVRHITAGTAETMEANWCNSVSIPLFDQWQVAETTEANWCHLLTTTLFAQWQGPAHHGRDWSTSRCHSVSFTLFIQWQGPAHHCRDRCNSGGQSMPFGVFNSLRSVTKSHRTQQGPSVKTGQVKYVSIFAQGHDPTLQDAAGAVKARQVNCSFSSHCLYLHTVTRFCPTGRFYRSSPWLYLCTDRQGAGCERIAFIHYCVFYLLCT